MTKSQYIPALKYHWLTHIYDPLIRWTLRESVFKQELIKQADIKNGHRVLDLGCGTATLTLLAKQTHPRTEVTGLDGDPGILAIAQKKIAQSRLSVRLAQGMSYQLPFADSVFDRVLSSLFFHHLTNEDKVRTLKEIFRVLRPGGELHIADWGRPHNLLMRSVFTLVQLLDGFETTNDNVRGLLPEMIRMTGFNHVTETSYFSTVFGTLRLIKAQKG
jgi:ubiquinone/menaquinone biosynthesis C-methylase UbiE